MTLAPAWGAGPGQSAGSGRGRDGQHRQRDEAAEHRPAIEPQPLHARVKSGRLGEEEAGIEHVAVAEPRRRGLEVLREPPVLDRVGPPLEPRPVRAADPYDEGRA
jgi:hypothetical protein